LIPHRPRRGADRHFYLGFALGRVATILLLPVVSRALGTSGFGIFESSMVVLMAAGIIIDSGLATSIVRFLPRPANGDDSVFVGAAFAAQIVLAAAAASFAVVAVLVVPPGGSRLLAAVCAASFCLVEGLATLDAGLLRAYGETRFYLLLSISRLVVTVLLGWIGAKVAGGAGALLGIAFGGIGFALHGVWWWLTRPGVGNAATRRTLLRYGLPLMSAAAMNWVLAVSDRLFLRATVTPAKLSEYSANYRIGSLVIVFIAGPLGMTWTSRIRRMETEDLPVASMTIVWCRWFSRIALAVTAVSILALPTVVPIVFGAAFPANPYIVLATGVAGWLSGLSLFVGVSILRRQETTAILYVAVPVTIGTLIVNGILITTIGLYGAAISTVLGYGGLVLAMAVVVRRSGGSLAVLQSRRLVAEIALLLGTCTVAAVFVGA
jgi:O-antigen/teichoic acid export membrane protein